MIVNNTLLKGFFYNERKLSNGKTNKSDYGLRTQRGGRQRGILIRLAIAVVYDNRVQYSYSFCLICPGDACDARGN